MTIVSINGKMGELLEDAIVYLYAERAMVLSEKNEIYRAINEGKKCSYYYDYRDRLDQLWDENIAFEKAIKRYRNAMKNFSLHILVRRKEAKQDVTD